MSRESSRSLEDIYSRTDSIRGRLGSLGYPRWSQKLSDAVAGGATSGEILMAVRWHLQELRKATSDLPADLRSDIAEVLRLIRQTKV